MEIGKIFPTTITTTIEPQPIELDPSITEITTENIPNKLIPDNNDKISITERQPFRSTSWIWSSTKKRKNTRRIQYQNTISQPTRANY